MLGHSEGRASGADEKTLPKSLRKSLRRYLKDTRPDIDWDDADQRRQELHRMVVAASRLLDEVYDRDEVKEAAELLAAIVVQDVEIDPDTGTPRIRQGTEKDRIVSTTDPEMRQGRKSRSARFDGHKLHVVEDQATEIILGVDVGAGNGKDGDHAAPLVSGVQ